MGSVTGFPVNGSMPVPSENLIRPLFGFEKNVMPNPAAATPIITVLPIILVLEGFVKLPSVWAIAIKLGAKRTPTKIEEVLHL